MILNKIKNFFLKNKKEILFFSFLAIFIFSIGDTFAADQTKDGMSSIIEGINLLLKIFSTLIGLLTSLISLLLNPGWVNGTIFGFDTYLRNIWVLISNIVYFAFAFILIIIAFMNIVGKGGGTWELKSALPKFVVGVIMVPFTWFFVQFILSISAFLTISVLSLPYDVMQDKDTFKDVKDNKICTVYTFDLTTNKKSADSTKELDDCLKDPLKSIKIGDLLSGNTKSNTSSSSIFAIINIYTYGIMKIQDADKITKNQLEEVTELSDLTVKTIFDILFMIIFLIIMVALFMALFSRGVWLWIYAMFSPVFGLLFFFGKSKDGVNKISPVEFIKLSLVPVYVAAALAFGMIFMFVAAQGLTDTKDGNSFFATKKDGDVKYSVLTLGDFKIRLKGIQGGATNTNTLFNSLGNGIGQLLLEIFGLVILWIAVMSALKSSEITGNIIKPIASFGESIGSLVAKAPQYAPIIPTPGGAVSTNALSNIGSSAKNYFESTVPSKQASDFMGKYNLFGNQGDINKVGAEVSNAIASGSTEAIAKAGIKMIKKGGELNSAIKNKEVISKILDIAKSSKVNIQKYKDIKVEDIYGNKDKYLELIREIDRKMETKLGTDFIKGVANGDKNSFKTESQYNNFMKKLTENDTPTTSSGTSTGAESTAAAVQTAIKIENINKSKININVDGKKYEINKSKIIDNGKNLDENQLGKELLRIFPKKTIDERIEIGKSLKAALNKDDGMGGNDDHVNVPD